MDTPLFSALKHSLTEMAEILIEAGADVNAKNLCGWMPLFVASMNGHAEVVKYLVEI